MYTQYKDHDYKLGYADSLDFTLLEVVHIDVDAI